MIYTKPVIRQALSLSDFDVSSAHALMTPVARGARPSDMPGKPKQGAVLVATYAKDGQGYLVLTRRRDDLDVHPGQISFPGGQLEPGESLRKAAFREAHEEIGLQAPSLELLGELSTIYIPPTDFDVHPFVAWHDGTPEFVPQDREVAEIIEVPVSHLVNPVNRRKEPWNISGMVVEVPYYLFVNHRIWGATAIIMSELIERIREVS